MPHMRQLDLAFRLKAKTCQSSRGRNQAFRLVGRADELATYGGAQR